ncbi:Hypothetical predicted protein, partial [Marmota monax]
MGCGRGGEWCGGEGRAKNNNQGSARFPPGALRTLTLRERSEGSRSVSATRRALDSDGTSDGKVEAEAETPRGLVSMPGQMKGKTGIGESGVPRESRSDRRQWFQVNSSSKLCFS